MLLEEECAQRGNRLNQVRVYRGSSAEIVRRDGRIRSAKAPARRRHTPGAIVRVVGRHRTRYYKVDERQALRSMPRAAALAAEASGGAVVTEHTKGEGGKRGTKA